jgi:Flp pilus assembly protein TadB
MSMRLARPVYESLPYLYMAIGGLAIFLFYVDPVGPRATLAFVIGVIAETAALTLYLRRQDYRELSREYSGETIELPSTLKGQRY